MRYDDVWKPFCATLTWTVTRDEKIVGEDYVFIFNEKPIVLFTQGRQDNQETRMLTCSDILDLSCFTNPNYSYSWQLSSGRIENDKASTITVADLNVGETTVWLTISNTKYDNCISEGSMVVVNQTLNPKVKAEVLTTANSSVVLVADEPPANATKHLFRLPSCATVFISLPPPRIFFGLLTKLTAAIPKSTPCSLITL